MRGQHDHAVLLAGKSHNEIAHVHRADGGVRSEGVLFKLIVLELTPQELLGLHVSRAGGPARTDGHKLARVFVGLAAVEVLLGLRDSRRSHCSEHNEAENDPSPGYGENHCAASFAFRRDG